MESIMTLNLLSIISILLSSNVLANQNIELENAPGSWVNNLYQDCINLNIETSIQLEDYLLTCVNEQLALSGYQEFKNFSALKSTIEKEE